ncbi:hypothetical protein YC2023_037695 [Brassica napus]
MEAINGKDIHISIITPTIELGQWEEEHSFRLNRPSCTCSASKERQQHDLNLAFSKTLSISTVWGT